LRFLAVDGHLNRIARLLAVVIQVATSDDLDAVTVLPRDELVRVVDGLTRGEADGLPTSVLEAGQVAAGRAPRYICGGSGCAWGKAAPWCGIGSGVVAQGQRDTHHVVPCFSGFGRGGILVHAI